MVALGHVLHVLLSSSPRPEASRLACLNRIPIAVAAGRINRSQIFDFSSWMDERNWQFTMFHRCPAKRHTQSNDPSNGTFVASNVRTHESTPEGWGSWFSIFATCLRKPRIPVYIGEVYKPFDLGLQPPTHTLRLVRMNLPCWGFSAPRTNPCTSHLYIYFLVGRGFTAAPNPRSWPKTAEIRRFWVEIGAEQDRPRPAAVSGGAAGATRVRLTHGHRLSDARVLLTITL